MKRSEILTELQSRLNRIVNDSYEILCNKVVQNSISVPNEASLQLHFGTVLKQVGVLHEYSLTDGFKIELELPIELSECTAKSKGKARCDIYMELTNGKYSVYAAIELKHFKYSKTQEATTDNRFALLCDLENMEHYKEQYWEQDKKLLQCYAIVYTDNINYTKESNGKRKSSGMRAFDLKGEISGVYEYTKERKVNLKLRHNADWDSFSVLSKNKESISHNFLKITF